MRTLLFLLCYTLLFFKVNATLQIKNNNVPISFIQETESIVDSKNEFTANFLLEHNELFTKKGVVAFGFTNQTVWTHLKTHYTIQKQTEWYIDLDDSNLDTLEVFVFENRKQIYTSKTGDHFKFTERPLHYTGFIFPLTMNPNKTYDIFIRVRSTSNIKIPITLDPIKTYDKSKFPRKLLFGAFYGIIAVMFLYNFIIGLSIKDESYFYYSLAILFKLGFYICYDGYALQYFWGNHPYFNYKFLYLNIQLANIFYLLNTFSFLDISKKKNLVYKLFIGMIIINSTLLAYIIVSPHIIGKLIIMSVSSSLLFSLAISLYKLYKGDQFVKYFLPGWIVYHASSIFTIGMTLGLLPYNSFNRYAIYGGTIAMVILLSRALANKYRTIQRQEKEAKTKIIDIHKKHSEELEQKVAIRTNELNLVVEELSTTLEHVNEQNTIIQNKSDLITNSIEYAKHIQNAITPPLDLIETLTKDFFVFYQPKDIVSGDIYWFKEIDGSLFFASIDCTGHGVPGAFLTMMAVNLLDSCVKNKDDMPNDILTKVDYRVKTTLKNSANQDGMDIALCKFNHSTRELSFSGAHTCCTIVSDEKLIELPRTKRAIGSTYEEHQPFKLYKFNLKEDDILYLYTDGYKDQFGGKKNKKFLKRRLNFLLQKIHQDPLAEQQQVLKNALNQWKKGREQIDDILIMGIKL